MSVEDSPESMFADVLWELRSYLDELVLVGGWVPAVYRRYGGFKQWHSQLSLTMDVDLLLDRQTTSSQGEAIADRLTEAGFQPENGGAVWAGDLERGEKIEFLTPHQGTAGEHGKVVPVGRPTGLGAISLDDLSLLRAHTRTLRIPFRTGRKQLDDLHLQVPLLGAYAVNKASTFGHRRPTAGEGTSKQGKDLLYLRDLLAAGEEVERCIEADLRVIAAAGPAQRALISYAASQLELTRSTLEKHVRAAAQILAEREPALGTDVAWAGIQGHLTDLAEVMRQVSD
jgi:hypothetical protein